ncbi:MAG: DNA repair protein RecO [Clostridia bacterium]|nr:DNA repair protein RecO [Clostridia bacterium]
MIRCSRCLVQTSGKISCAARGARRPNSGILAATQFLSFGEYVLYKGSGGTYNINSAQSIEVFYNLRTDLDKLQYAAYIAKIVEDVTNENDSSYNILRLVLNTVYAISETNMDKDLIVAIFKMRLLSLIRIYSKCLRMCIMRNKGEYYSL